MTRRALCTLMIAAAVMVLPAALTEYAQARPRDTNHCLGFDASWPDPEGVTPPKLVRQVLPRYPLKSAIDRASGVVIVQFIVTKDGKVDSPRIACSDPKRRFDDAALDAVREWVYEPATKDGQPVVYVGMQATVAFGVSAD